MTRGHDNMLVFLSMFSLEVEEGYLHIPKRTPHTPLNNMFATNTRKYHNKDLITELTTKSRNKNQ